jgi:hypothetical protein
MRRRVSECVLIIAAGLAGIVTIACTAGAGKQQSLATVRTAIEAEIARSIEATRRQDIDTYMDGFAPEFEIQADDGAQGTLADLRAHALRDWAIIPATRDIRERIDSMGPVVGDSAVVYTAQRWDRLMLERDGITRDTVVTTQRHRELWRRTSRGWRRAGVKELGGTVEVNGKPYQE